MLELPPCQRQRKNILSLSYQATPRVNPLQMALTCGGKNSEIEQEKSWIIEYYKNCTINNNCHEFGHTSCGAINVQQTRAQCYQLIKLFTAIISYSLCPWQTFPAYSNVCR